MVLDGFEAADTNNDHVIFRDSEAVPGDLSRRQGTKCGRGRDVDNRWFVPGWIANPRERAPGVGDEGGDSLPGRTVEPGDHLPRLLVDVHTSDGGDDGNGSCEDSAEQIRARSVQHEEVRLRLLQGAPPAPQAVNPVTT
jgi:hypothetical protein